MIEFILLRHLLHISQVLLEMVFFAKESDKLQVVSMAVPSMQISVLPGQGFINGYWYENTDVLNLPIDIADGVLNRIDSVVLRIWLG